MKKITTLLAVSLMLFTACSRPQPSAIEQSATESVAQESEVAQSASKESSEASAKNQSDAENGAVTIYLTRHGKTMLNSSDRVQGWCDSPLTESGVEVAQYLGKGLALLDIVFEAAYSSDSGRSIETAQIVLDVLGQSDLELKQMKGLREWNFGIFEGDLNDNMLASVIETVSYQGEEDIRLALTLPELADGIAAADETETAENWDAISKRSFQSFQKLANEVHEAGGGDVLVVSHGLTINAILKMIDPDFETVQISNAAVTKIRFVNNAFEIIDINDKSYIELGEKAA